MKAIPRKPPAKCKTPPHNSLQEYLLEILKQLKSISKQLKSTGAQIMATEKNVIDAVNAARDKVTGDIAAALTKEKQELIDLIKANAAGMSEQGLATILDSVASIGVDSVAGIDKLSVDASS